MISWSSLILLFLIWIIKFLIVYQKDKELSLWFQRRAYLQNQEINLTLRRIIPSKSLWICLWLIRISSVGLRQNLRRVMVFWDLVIIKKRSICRKVCWLTKEIKVKEIPSQEITTSYWTIKNSSHKLLALSSIL